LLTKIASEGVAPLKSGNAGSLFRTEQALELTLKAQILQDIWTPWLEGLAVFGEIACDPSLDPIGISPVANYIRNLIDFHPPSNSEGVFDDRDAIVAAYEKFAEEFEMAWSKSIAERGPTRLATYLRLREEPYFAGYMAVRGVVAAWRERVGRPLTSTEAFNLLLHATRFGTFEAIPDLALRHDAFLTKALDNMQRWAKHLANLPATQLEDFLRPPQKNGPGRNYQWDDGRLVEIYRDDKDVAADQAKVAERFIGQARRTLTNPSDVDRISAANELCRWILASSSEALADGLEQPDSQRRLAEYVDRHAHLIAAGSLLPIGRTAAKFFLNSDPESPNSRLALQLRTTEAHAKTGQPSMNGWWIPADKKAGELIAHHYRRSGASRVEVTRIIDLGGVVTPQARQLGIHFLAYGYGDWFDIGGPSQAIDALIAMDDGRRAGVRDLTRERIQPTPIARAELEIMAPGHRGAERTRSWIDGSTVWQIGDDEVPVQEWATHVRNLAENVNSDSARRTRQQQSARDLLECLFNDALFARNVVDAGLAGLTARCPEHRHDIVGALFRSAKLAGPDPFCEQHNSMLHGLGFAVFHRGTTGWDVKPATPRD
jgi:hypothetical protein